MYGMKRRCFGKGGREWTPRREAGWNRGRRWADEFGDETGWRPGWRRHQRYERAQDTWGTPPPWAGFWRGHAPDMSLEERKQWLLARREHLKERLAEVEAELRELGV